MTLHPRLLDAFDEGRPGLGCWSRGGAFSLSAVRQAGLDFIAIDCQHSDVDEAAAASTLVGLTSPDLVRVARVSRNEASLIGRLADAGAHYVIVPMVETVQDAEAAVNATKYPPFGTRSFGPFHESLGRDPATISQQVGVLAMIETSSALEIAAQIAMVQGLAGVYVGPADLAISLDLDPATALHDGTFREHLRTVARIFRDRGLVAGIHAGDGVATAALVADGYNMVTMGNERTALTAALSKFREDALRTHGPAHE